MPQVAARKDSESTQCGLLVADDGTGSLCYEGTGQALEKMGSSHRDRHILDD